MPRQPTSFSTRAREASTRAPLVDAARGVAVLTMVVWHTADAFFSPEHRDGLVFVVTRIVGGLAAPLFFLLAGLVTALGRRPSVWLGLARAARVYVAGVALSLFAFGVDRAGALQATELPALLPAALAAALLLRILGDPRRASRRELGAAALACIACALLLPFAPGTRQALLRLDVLHGIGAALAALTLGLSAAPEKRPAGTASALAAGAIVITLVTEPLTTSARAALVETHPLDTILSGILVRGPRARFSLVPWLAYAMAGASIGILAREKAALFDSTRSRRLVIALLAIILVATSDAGLLAAWTPEALAWTGILRRLGYNLAVLGAIFIALASLRAMPQHLVLLGRRSLAAYCIHLELAFGLVGLPLHDRLHPFAWALAALAVLGLTTLAVGSLERWSARERRAGGREPAEGVPFPLEGAEND